MSRVFTCICGQELRAESDEAIFRVAKEHATTKHADKRYSDQDLQTMLRENGYTAGPPADSEAVTLVKRVFREVWEKGDEKAAQASFSPDYTNHDPASPEVPPGPRGVIENVKAYRTGFPDLKFTFNETIVTGDKVVVRWTVSGTHQGTFRDLAPSRKTVSLSGISVFRIANRKIVESWANWDQAGLYQQIGAVPSFARAGAR